MTYQPIIKKSICYGHWCERWQFTCKVDLNQGQYLNFLAYPSFPLNVCFYYEFLTENNQQSVCLQQKQNILPWVNVHARRFGFETCLENFECLVMDPVTLYEDNQFCIRIAETPKDNKRMNHVDRKYHFIRQTILDGDTNTYEQRSNLQTLWQNVSSCVNS